MSTREFNQLLLQNSEYLKPFAVTLTKDQESAKDLLQETMFRALSNQEKYSVGTNIKAWLYTIMRNIFINNYRRKSKQNTIFDNTPNEFLLEPSIFKQPFMLYFQGYKYHEIADMLNEPLGTIKSRIHFARRLLKDQINKF